MEGRRGFASCVREKREEVDVDFGSRRRPRLVVIALDFLVGALFSPSESEESTRARFFLMGDTRTKKERKSDDFVFFDNFRVTDAGATISSSCRLITDADPSRIPSEEGPATG